MGGRGGSKRGYRGREGGVIFGMYLLDTDGHATCKCMYIHINTYTHTHIHTCTHILMVTVRVNFQQDLKRLGCPFRSKLCEWEWTQVSTDPTAQYAQALSTHPPSPLYLRTPSIPTVPFDQL